MGHMHGKKLKIVTIQNSNSTFFVWPVHGDSIWFLSPSPSPIIHAIVQQVGSTFLDLALLPVCFDGLFLIPRCRVESSRQTMLRSWREIHGHLMDHDVFWMCSAKQLSSIVRWKIFPGIPQQGSERGTKTSAAVSDKITRIEPRDATPSSGSIRRSVIVGKNLT